MAPDATDQQERLICLVRHGEAKSKEEDAARPLSDQGRETADWIAGWAAAAGVKVDQIRHSGKLRAQQTAEIFAAHLGPPDGVIAALGLSPNDDVEPVAETLANEDRSVMLVGHLPFLARLVSHLVIGQREPPIVQFDAAALAILSQQKGQWTVLSAMQPELLPQDCERNDTVV